MKVATDTSNAKLTQRQVRIANLVKGDNFDFGGPLLNDPSSMSIKTKLGMSDGIRSTKAFMTSVTPNKPADIEPNLGFASDTQSPKDSARNMKGPRKVFGAAAFLERQKTLGLGRHSSPPPAEQT